MRNEYRYVSVSLLIRQAREKRLKFREPSPRIVAAVGAGVTFAVIGLLLWPQPPMIADTATGDPALIEQVRNGLQFEPGPHHHLSVAVLEGDELSVANFGTTGDTEFEVGSVTKTFTAALFAEAIARGEVKPDTRLGELLDLGDAPAASVTLQQLATHTSGLPGVPETPQVLLRTLLMQFTANDPYTFDLPALLEQARGAQLSGDPTVGYSNFGFSLLGQALAKAAGTDYPTLVTERIIRPLGLRSTYAPASVSDLRASAPTGYTASGRPSDAWTLDAYAPAGSIRSTLTDLISYARAQLDETAPGVDATKPRLDAGGLGEIGWAWFTTEGITWHNGMTGGFASYLAFDREADRAVVILSDTAVSVDLLGFTLMGIDVTGGAR